MNKSKTMMQECLPDGSMTETTFESQMELVADPNALSHIITELMRPVMQTIGKMLENNTAALEQLSSAQSIQNDRLEALERQIRLQTPVTSKQVTYLNDAIRQRARALLDKKKD